LKRRVLLSLPLLAAACGEPPRELAGGWIGAAQERGHRVRDATLPAPAVQRRAGAIVVGGGIAGLAAMRALVRAGVDDAQLFELEDEAGGNSRGYHIAGMACPLGAHYLPLPGPHAHEVSELLEELGLARSAAGRWVYDERHLCHSPQERLFIDGAWHDSLLPPADGDTLNQYRRFANAVDDAQRRLGFAMPTHRAPWTADHAALDAQPFGGWLSAQGLADAKLRWTLDYACRDDYGAGIDTVSAWAGLHYFASRHGFHADADGERETVLTWPEGNAWLARRIAAPLSERIHAGCTVQRVAEQRHGVSVDLWNESAQRAERWTAPRVVLALPVFVAARVLESPPAALVQARTQGRYAPWLVANVHIDAPLLDRAGAPPAWDNVAYGSPLLGYVDAMHQATRPHAGPTVLTAYWALPESERGALGQRPWQAWAKAVVDDLTVVHPDLPRKLKRVDLMRYGHSMSIPAPGVRGSAALRTLGEMRGRVQFAHADLSGYSVFEEAFTWGDRVGRRVAASL